MSDVSHDQALKLVALPKLCSASLPWSERDNHVGLLLASAQPEGETGAILPGLTLQFEIGTPFSYSDGGAIVLYALEEGDRILLSDNGEMLAHLEAVGVPVGRCVATLRDRVARFGLTLGDQGDVRILVPAEQGAHMLATAISGLLSVAEWEREQVGLDEQTQNLAEEAEILLREWKPGAALERRPKIKGQSKREHTFAFLMDGEYIDVIPANHTATGATMRKAGDVKNSPYLAGREIRVVIDDRRDPDRADVEQQILGSLVRSMTLTKLQSLAKPGPVQ